MERKYLSYEKIWQTLSTKTYKNSNSIIVGTVSAQFKAEKYHHELPKKKEMERFLEEQMKELRYGR